MTHQLAVNQVVTERGLCCRDCGHPTYFHRSNGVTQNLALDDPVPCFAVTDRNPRPVRPGVAQQYEYTFCLCTTVHLLKDETHG